MCVGRSLGGIALATMMLVVAPARSLADGPATTSAGSDSIACPVRGEHTFEDSYGWARSGGRRHQGIDLVAERGTPVVAAIDGAATFKNSRLGGRSVWLDADDGRRFFYAHLDAWEGDSRAVERGEVIGYVGSSGNARGPHLHFEAHVDGGTDNPFDALVAACTASTTPVPTGPPGPDRIL